MKARARIAACHAAREPTDSALRRRAHGSASNDGLLVEKDGFKAFFTGDSFTNWGVDNYCSQNRCFIGRDVGYEKCLKLLLDTKPDILIAAHWGPEPVSAEYLRKTLDLFQQREKLYQRLFCRGFFLANYRCLKAHGTHRLGAVSGRSRCWPDLTLRSGSWGRL